VFSTPIAMFATTNISAEDITADTDLSARSSSSTPPTRTDGFVDQMAA
jgi:hypothetical protein